MRYQEKLVQRYFRWFSFLDRQPNFLELTIEEYTEMQKDAISSYQGLYSTVPDYSFLQVVGVKVILIPNNLQEYFKMLKER